MGWEQGSWVAAYLVLVVGVGQLGLGVAQAALAPRPPTPRLVSIECALWNVSSLFVITGTLLDVFALVAAGAAAMLGASALFAYVAPPTGGRRQRRAAWAYHALLVILIVSIPVGVALSWLRS
jgi:hypothetical protein